MADPVRPSTRGRLSSPVPNEHGRNPMTMDSLQEMDEYGYQSSEDGDVFAYGPPTTADQMQHHPQDMGMGMGEMERGDMSVDQTFSYAIPIDSKDPSLSFPPHRTNDIPSPPLTSSTPPSTGPNEYRMRPLTLSLAQDTSQSSSKYPRRDSERDVNTSTGTMNTASAGTSIKMEFDFDQMGIGGDEEEDSPYPEVRASVSNTDDPDMPSLTLRAWLIGLTLSLLASGTNVFFNFRQPGAQIPALVVLLLAHPCGKFLAYALPIRSFKVGTWRLGRRWVVGGWEWSLNPGPWNIKEHALVFIMANVTQVPPYSMTMIVVSEKMYGIHRGFGFNLLLTLATQLTGFGLAGLTRRFLIWPASMVWPQNLVICTLLNTLHAEDDWVLSSSSPNGNPNNSTSSSKWGLLMGRAKSLFDPSGISRYKFFLLASIAAFTWFVLPGYLFTALSLFGWVTWIRPNNVVVNQLFGVASGLGMSVVTFDWTEISWIGSPLVVPWWAEVHIFIGFVLVFWILTPVLYYTNVWNFAYFPISGTSPFDNTGAIYNVNRVLTANKLFNVTAYEEYSPLYLPACYAMTYLIAFATATCLIVHTILYHGQSMLNAVKKIRIEADDIHAHLMRSYPEVPDWWYLSLFVAFFGLAVIIVEAFHTGIPVYILVLSLLLPIIYVLPGGFIFAMTGQTININLLAQIVPGALVTGNPVVNMIFKSYSIQTLLEAFNFAQDLKLGHYIKVPPRKTFVAQLTATTLAAFLQMGVKTWMFANVQGICDKDQPDLLVCPKNHVFFTASAVWGLIGPTRQFGPHTLYHPQLYALIIGAILPIPFWLYQRYVPNTRLKFVHIPVLLNGIGSIPPATGINYSSWFAMGFVFQYLIRKRNFAWWSKFNYILSASLDTGTVLCVLAIFFFLQFPFPKGGPVVNWWGNNVYVNTADYQGASFKSIPPTGIPNPYFSPPSS